MYFSSVTVINTRLGIQVEAISSHGSEPFPETVTTPKFVSGKFNLVTVLGPFAASLGG